MRLRTRLRELKGIFEAVQLGAGPRGISRAQLVAFWVCMWSWSPALTESGSETVITKKGVEKHFPLFGKAQGELDLCFLRSAAWLSYIRSFHDIASSDPLTAIYWSFF